MTTNNFASVSNHFSKNWELYLQSVQNGMLHHCEMFSTLDSFLTTHLKLPFSLADLGCGDGSAVIGALMNKPLIRYIGVDAVSDLISRASKVMGQLWISNFD